METRAAVSQRCDGRTMANSGQIVAATEGTRTQAHRSPARAQCHLVCRSQRLSVADVAKQFSLLEHGLRHFLEVAAGRGLARHSRCTPGACPSGGRQEGHAVRGDYRQPIDSHCRGRRRAGLRCGEKDHRTQAALVVVDTLGLVLTVVVHGAYWQDHDGAGLALIRLQARFGRLKVLFADSAYGGNGLPEWVRETFGWVLQTVLRPVAVKGFVVLPKRWIIERTFAWLARYRRNSKDYERTTESSEAIIHLSMINLMSRRLAHLQK